MITFKHSGQLGDIVYSLFTVKSICGDSKKAIFYINLYQPIILNLTGNTYVTYGVDKESYKFIVPLIAAQPYIEKVLVYNGEVVDVDFDYILFKVRYGIAPQKNIIEYFSNIDYSNINKWLNLPSFNGFPNLNIFSRSRRYRNETLNYAEVAKKFCFVGLRAEVDFDIPRIPVQNALQLANLLNHCNCFLGNQSLPYAIAWGLDVQPRALEIGPVRNVNDDDGVEIYDNVDLFNYCSKINATSTDYLLHGDNIESVDAEKFVGQFDEVFYLNNHRDVMAAVLSGELKSGKEHYLLHGMQENRKMAKIK